MFPKAFLRDQKKVKEFECRDDDVWVASFPKTGEQIGKNNQDKDTIVKEFRNYLDLGAGLRHHE